MSVIVGDCLEVMASMAAESFDSIVTDPPYHLTNNGGGPGRGNNNAYSRARAGAASGGFMGKAWDGGDIAFRPETWAAALRIAKPGAYLLAFGGTRTFHRLACAIEDAGWELRDTLMWVYGSGFPKSKNIGGGWGTALKPAWEPIIMARKPLALPNVAANVAEFGTGALNIDGCRIGDFQNTTPSGVDRRNAKLAEMGYRPGQYQMGEKTPDTPPGRWPANLIHDGSEEVISLFPQSDGQQAAVRGDEPSSPFRNAYGDMSRSTASAPRGDAGSAARFFYCAKADRADRNDGCEGLAAKPLNWSSGTQSPGTFQAQGTDRTSANHHPTVKPTDLMRWLCRLVTPPGGHVLDPFCGSGSTGRGAVAEGFEFDGIELDPEYAAIAERRIRVVQPGLPLGATA